MKQGLEVAAYACAWYLCSVTFTLANKLVLQYWECGFHFPLCMVSVHMWVKWLLAVVVLHAIMWRRRRQYKGHLPQRIAQTEEEQDAQSTLAVAPGQQVQQHGGIPKVWLAACLCCSASPCHTALCSHARPALGGVQISWRVFLTQALPVGVATSLDISLGNVALMYISITLVTVCGAAVLRFACSLCVRTCSYECVVIAHACTGDHKPLARVQFFAYSPAGPGALPLAPCSLCVRHHHGCGHGKLLFCILPCLWLCLCPGRGLHGGAALVHHTAPAG